MSDAGDGGARDRSDFERFGILAATVGEHARVYHVGFVVPDLEAAMAHLGEALGVTFVPPMQLPYPELMTPDGPKPAKLRLTYATRPVHVELIESCGDTLWDWESRQRGHHLGVWADDIEAEADRLDALGMPRLWWVHGDDGKMVFSYHDTPYGFYIELVGSVAKAFYPAMFTAVDPTLQLPG
jgi:hypothetical protein